MHGALYEYIIAQRDSFYSSDDSSELKAKMEHTDADMHIQYTRMYTLDDTILIGRYTREIPGQLQSEQP